VVTAVVVFGVIVLIVAAEVIHLARDARADMEGAEVDVFDRRRDAAHAAAQSIIQRSRSLAEERRRDLPTIPALPRH
jgi:hypothetical protein